MSLKNEPRIAYFCARVKEVGCTRQGNRISTHPPPDSSVMIHPCPSRPRTLTCTVISRHDVKDKGDVDEFNIEWDIRQGVLRQAEQWETHVTYRTKHLKISVAFRGTRPPRHPMVIEGNCQSSQDLANRTEMLPDGRSRVTWETHRPRLYENYVLQWER